MQSSTPFHVLEWRGEDTFDGAHGTFCVTGFGRDLDGKTTSVRFTHLPTFLVRAKRPDPAESENRARGKLRGVREAVLDMLGEKLHPSSAVVKGKPYTGWQSHEDLFLRLVFYTRRDMRRVGDLFRKRKMDPAMEEDCPDWFLKGRFVFETYELDADPVLQALTSLGVPPTGWVSCPVGPVRRNFKTRCAVHYECTPTAMKDADAPQACAPHVAATFDIEAFSSRSTWTEQIFPDAEVAGDAVTQICTFFSRFGESKPYHAESLVLLKGACPEPARSTVESLVPVHLRYFRSEGALLRAWVRSYADNGVSIWCHFNGLGFDEAYLHARCALHDVDMAIMALSGDRRAPRLVESKLESNAYGWNLFRTVELGGVFHLDIMQDIKKNHNLESYSLDSCAEQFVPGGGSKTGLKPQQQFDCYSSEKPEDIEKLTEYCCQDVALTYRLMERLAMLPSVMETAAVSWVTPTYLVTRGQQIRVYSCVKREIYERGAAYFLRDTKKDPPAEGGYKGATVLEPKRAPWFYPRAIVSLDFASLYPSIMMQYNLSHETWTDKKVDPADFYVHEPGCAFARASVQKGVLPAILMKLKASRKRYKKSMGFHEKEAHEATDEKVKAHHAFMEKVYDAKQKATKVTMNSVYGFCGVANNGKQPCLPLAAATTTIGRRLIEQTKTFCEKHVQGSEVVYGDTDSVMWNVWPDREVNQQTISDAFEKAEETCRAIAPIFRHDGADFILLEFENVYVNYLLLGKKIYSTLQYSADLGPSKPKKTVKKGLRCVRRDTIELARQSQATCVEHITNNRVDMALEEGRACVRRLFEGDVPFEDLAMSKKISSSYRVMAEPLVGEKVKVVVTPHGKWHVEEAPETKGTCEVKAGRPWKMLDKDGKTYGQLTLAQPHVHVMHRMEERTPNGGPRVGDRVRYVFVKGEGGNADLQISRAEDPAHAKERGMRPDAVYYFEHSLRSPLDAVLSLFTDKGCMAELGWSLELLTAKNKLDNQKSLSSFGFGVPNPVGKQSRVARPVKRQKNATGGDEKTRDVGQNSLRNFFKK